MTAPVDVLGLLDTMIGIERMTELRPARDAMAELIAADLAYDEAVAMQVRLMVICSDELDPDISAARQAVRLAKNRRAAALARVRGAS